MTYSTAKKGPNTTHWQDAEDTEISRLIDSVVMHARHPHEQPADRKKDTTYYNPQTKEKDTDAGKTYRIRGTIGGDRINYTGVTKANTAAMPVVKMLLQSVVSDDAEFMTIDIKDFYLNTELPRSEWMRIPVKFLSAAILDKHNLRPFINDGVVIFEVVKSLYGLPHAGKISQDELIRHLATHGYHQTTTPCLFRHDTNGIAFTLVVDDFGIKFRERAAAQHLIDTLLLRYQITIKFDATKYLGLTLFASTVPSATSVFPFLAMCRKPFSVFLPPHTAPILLPSTFLRKSGRSYRPPLKTSTPPSLQLKRQRFRPFAAPSSTTASLSTPLAILQLLLSLAIKLTRLKTRAPQRTVYSPITANTLTMNSY